MEIKEISDLLDTKLEPINNRLNTIESKIDILSDQVKKILKFVAIENDDIDVLLKKKRSA